MFRGTSRERGVRKDYRGPAREKAQESGICAAAVPGKEA
jgi:hypothetical protein